MDLAAHKDRFEVLHRAAGVLHSSLEIEVVLERLMDELLGLSGAERGLVILLDPQKSGDLDNLALYCRAGRNLNGCVLDTQAFEYSRHIVLRCLETREPQLTYDASQDPRYAASESIRTHNLRSVLVVPLTLRNRLLGAVYVDNRVRTGVFGEEDCEMMVALSQVAAIALENARLYNELRSKMLQNLVMKNYQWALLHSVGNGILAVDAEGKVTTFNRAAQSILGLERQPLRSKRLEEVVSPAGAECLLDLLEEMRDCGLPLTGREVSFELPGRGTVFLRLSVSPLREPGSKTAGATLVMEDLTGIRLAEQAHRREEKQRQYVQDLFGRMVSPEVMEELLKEQGLEIQGKRQNITILFADINGFTAVCEQKQPGQVISMLNEYFSEMNQIIFQHRGTVKQFAGDEILVFFGAPKPTSDHAVQAVRTAQAMLTRLAQLASQHSPEDGFYSIKIGIHTGEAVVGRVGSPDRFEFGAVGDAVNLASRLMHLGRTLGSQFLISRATRDRCGDLPGLEFHSLGLQSVEGRQEQVPVYEVRCQS